MLINVKEGRESQSDHVLLNMQNQKNRITILLMVISISLLLVLQYFWLKSSYENAREQLRKETSTLFRNTLSSIQDSLIQKRIRFIPDSLRPPRMEFWRSDNDSISHINMQGREARVQVYVSGDAPDSLQRMLRPLSERMMAGQRNFVVRLDHDSLNVDSVFTVIQSVFSNNEIDLPFIIHKLKRGEEQHQSDSLYTDPVRFPPFDRYSVIFANPNPFLWKRISSQVLFSIFLTLITITAFVFMYRSLASQQRLMTIKNDFISNVSHELKTPVATVSVAIEALKNFQALNNPEKTAEYLDIAQNELNRLTLMTDKILKTAVFENQELSFEQTQVNLAEVIERVLNSLKLVVEKDGATITFKKEGEQILIKGDDAHLTNMIYNLIDNALKYSLAKTEIFISLTQTEKEVILSIQDNGIGIAPDHHKKIFERFFRVPSGDVHNTKGYGLGLSYVANVVEKHGGRIKIESAINKGSHFFIYLPKVNG